MSIVTLGVDLGKTVCSLVGLDAAGKVAMRKRLRRAGLVAFVLNLDRCVVAMEACCGAHHLGRVFDGAGFDVRLMSPEYVKPYVKAHKNDDRDAEAIAEAATRPTMRFVRIKTQEQSDVQSLHRARSRLVSERTALINNLRSLLLERGITVAQGRKKLEAELIVFADEEHPDISPRIRGLIEDMRAQWRSLDARIAAFDKEFMTMAQEDVAAQRLMSIPGIGAINATAFVAAVGNAEAFRRGRDLAAWLGLTPRQASTGGRQKLLGISKRGNRYLRSTLIHGARAVLHRLINEPSQLGAWLRDLSARAHKNVVVVALAAKLARTIWALLRKEQGYQRVLAA
ncbi:IS110 family transposase [Yoonia sp.]|uniref:IS110 family transposase n=1 Tax=Yoonia sp. TaxID=2212373 RepID=UPI003976733A